MSHDHNAAATRTSSVDQAHLNALLENEIDIALRPLDGDPPLMGIMARYHLGMMASNGEPTSPETRLQVQGKRIRPSIAMLAAAAVGGSAESAAPIAAAVELLHNFTLIHDDIMDRSPNRRHRPTVWRVWGDAQAINAGDALFAAAQIAALRSADVGLEADATRGLATAFNLCTIDIVRGQIKDLDNEGQQDVTPDDYLDMIRGKTAAIIRFAAQAGAIVGGADDARAMQFAEVGEAIGMGFQIRDDMLGIWSPAEETGKDAADDIRRRKQSLPILILRSMCSPDELDTINALYRQEEVHPDGVQQMLELLERHAVMAKTAAHVDHAHARATSALELAAPDTANPAVGALGDLITRLNSRSF